MTPTVRILTFIYGLLCISFAFALNDTVQELVGWEMWVVKAIGIIVAIAGVEKLNQAINGYKII